MHKHLRIATNPSNSNYAKRLYASIRGILASGKTVVPRVVFETDDEVSALLREKSEIERHGFDNLLNVASHAMLGRRLKPCVYEKISSSIAAHWKRGTYRNKVRGPDHKPRKRGYTFVPKTRKNSAHRGVSLWSTSGKSKRWMTYSPRINGKRKTLGYFAVLEDALRCADDSFELHCGLRPNGTQKHT